MLTIVIENGGTFPNIWHTVRLWEPEARTTIVGNVGAYVDESRDYQPQEFLKENDALLEAARAALLFAPAVIEDRREGDLGDLVVHVSVEVAGARTRVQAWDLIQEALDSKAPFLADAGVKINSVGPAST